MQSYSDQGSSIRQTTDERLVRVSPIGSRFHMDELGRTYELQPSGLVSPVDKAAALEQIEHDERKETPPDRRVEHPYQGAPNRKAPNPDPVKPGREEDKGRPLMHGRDRISDDLEAETAPNP